MGATFPEELTPVPSGLCVKSRKGIPVISGSVVGGSLVINGENLEAKRYFGGGVHPLRERIMMMGGGMTCRGGNVFAQRSSV